MITTIIVQTIVNVGLHCTWSRKFCLQENWPGRIEDMVYNISVICDILKEVVNFIHVHEHNDFLVSIKVQEFWSRYAKYVCCT